MKRSDMEANFKKMVEHEILRQLRKVFGELVEYFWISSIWGDNPQIMVETPDFNFEIKVHIAGGRVHLLGLESKKYKNLFAAEVVDE